MSSTTKADYFGALMRSGGLLQPVRVRAAERPMAALQETVAEVPVSLTTPVAPPAWVAGDRPAAPLPVAETQTVTPTVLRPLETRVVLASVAPATDPVQRAEQVERASSFEPVAPQPNADPARSVVRTVMQWIAADPGAHPSALDSRVGTRAASDLSPMASTMPAPQRGATRTQQIDADLVSVPDPGEATPLLQAPSRGKIDAPTDIAWPVPRFARPITRPAPAELPAAEPMTVTIGAIHLRVDAPAVQTVAQPAPRPAPERNAQRSGLSRRALRRV